MHLLWFHYLSVILGMVRNEKNFLSFSTYLDPFWLEMKPRWCFQFFEFFCYFFFLEFSSLGRVGIVRNENFIFSLFQLVLTRLDLKWSQDDFFFFFEFFEFFFEILLLGSGRNGSEWIFFFSFLACPNPFWLEMKAGWCF